MSSSARAPRRFGRVNWVGLLTFARRDIHRAIKNFRYTLTGPLVSNLLFLAVFYLALGGREQWFGTIEFGQFLVAGLVITAIGERAFSTASESILYDKMEGIIWDSLMAPLTALERTIGYIVGAAGTGLIVGTTVLLALLPFVGLASPRPLLFFFFGIGGAILMALIGIIAGLWSERWDHQSAVSNFILLPLAFMSGGYYSTSELPAAAQHLIQFNPVFYVVDGFRAGMTGYHEGVLERGAVVVVVLAIVLFAVAYGMIRSGYKVKP
ncbi:MAG TPA: ABC transporter permease [Dongiaceae bacterium]|jgi:ABC-2 type transport system permease protein